MPPSRKFTKEELVMAALRLVRAGGPKALTARALAAALHSSPKVIFGVFDSMQALQDEVAGAAFERFSAFQHEEIARALYPPYKASGMAYIQFAAQEPELFRLLFLSPQSEQQRAAGSHLFAPMVQMVRENTGLSQDDATVFHLEMWMYVHGIAATIATAYAQWDPELVSRFLTDGYQGLRQQHLKRKDDLNGSHSSGAPD